MSNKCLKVIAIIWSLAAIAAITFLPGRPSPGLNPVAELTHRAGAGEAGSAESQPTPPIDPFRPFLDALMQVESGGDVNAVGDGGASIGPYQIGKPYWTDACGVDTNYETNVRDKVVCELVMFAYWNRYCRKALTELDFETLARIHNGGPRGDVKESTKPYWLKVKAEMEKSNESE